MITCGAMVPEGVSPDQIRLRAFPFSLSDKAKDWLYYMPAGSFTTWNDLHKAFLEKFFPASRVGSIRKEICGVKQLNGENFSEYWERFNKLVCSCPQHQITEQLLIQYFYEGLLPTERGIVDAASGGALVNKTPAQARELFNTIAQNTQQFGTRDNVVRPVSEIGNSSSLEYKLSALTDAISKLVVGNIGGSKGKPCGVCCLEGHPTDACPTLQNPEVNALFFNNNNQKKYDPFSNTYNEGWRDHPNLRYGPPRGNNLNFSNNPPPQQDRATQMLEQVLKKMDDKFTSVDISLKQLQERQTASETLISNMQAQMNNRLPSQPFPNPKENLNAIELRNKKVLKEPKSIREEEKELEVERRSPKQSLEPEIQPLDSEDQPLEPATSILDEDNEAEKSEEKGETDLSDRNPALPHLKAPFPSKFLQLRKPKEIDLALLDTFKKVEINLPLLEAIKQVPKYAKFLKELCTNKNRLTGNERVRMGENVSAVFQKKIPPKCKDPGVFTIPCLIGDLHFDRAMLDLGSSINVMPKDVFDKLNIGELKPTGVVIQLADRSYTYPEGLLEDILVKVNDLVFPADFYVLSMGSNTSDIPILLGRPFMKTARAKFDVYDGVLSLEFDGEKIEFNLSSAMKSPIENNQLCSMDVIDDCAQAVFNLSSDDVFDSVLCNSLDRVELECLEYSLAEFEELENLSQPVFRAELLENRPKLAPSLVSPPKLELKDLPDDLKYAFLGPDQTLPVIISSALTKNQEENLLRVLRENSQAIDRACKLNQVADHLSRLEGPPSNPSHFTGSFPDESLLALSTISWSTQNTAAFTGFNGLFLLHVCF
ncbi:unnamed protein product [Cuscuta campestris]|uniref:Retrotransposon gag domain-containing protein n=1 Tax=Cuscuta campestris TaxID=132261 RepID=A0A484MME9_9ASTE|nr:unnamed protein product [Cuscuta campestris]